MIELAAILICIVLAPIAIAIALPFVIFGAAAAAIGFIVWQISQLDSFWLAVLALTLLCGFCGITHFSPKPKPPDDDLIFSGPFGRD